MTIQARFHEKRIHFTFDIEMSIPMKGITAIFGPSGSGKTTLLRAIAGLDKFADGYLQVGHRVWQNRSLFKKTHHRPIGYVFQEPSLFRHLTVEKNLEYGLRRLPEQSQTFALDQAIALFDIGTLLNHYPAQLSGGESQRVAIARALAVNPQLLLMDEPLSSLDSKRKNEILPYLESLHNELDIPVIYVSHATDEVIRLADHLVMIDKGKITASGKIDEMLTHLKSPFHNNNDASSLVFAKVTGHDDTYGLTFADFPGGRFFITRKDLEPGQMIRLQIRAKDVSLTLQTPQQTSILNIFPATIEKLNNDGDSHSIVTLNAGGCPVLSRITRKSASLLDLQPGSSVYAQIKSAALLA